jgi:hypothetical protein
MEVNELYCVQYRSLDPHPIIPTEWAMMRYWNGQKYHFYPSVASAKGIVTHCRNRQEQLYYRGPRMEFRIATSGAIDWQPYEEVSDAV